MIQMPPGEGRVMHPKICLIRGHRYRYRRKHTWTCDLEPPGLQRKRRDPRKFAGTTVVSMKQYHTVRKSFNWHAKVPATQVCASAVAPCGIRNRYLEFYLRAALMSVLIKSFRESAMAKRFWGGGGRNINHE
jgi:hypothetical protein